MFSLERCRNILGDECTLDNDQLATLRDQLYGLAEIVIEELCAHREIYGYVAAEDSRPADYRAALKLLPENERADVEERAAIIEFEGGADRDEAERKAIFGSLQTRSEKKDRN